MDRIKTLYAAAQKFHRIGLNELKRVAGLRLNINPDHIEPGPVVAHCGTTGTAKQIKDSHCVGGLIPSVRGLPDWLASVAFCT